MSATARDYSKYAPYDNVQSSAWEPDKEEGVFLEKALDKQANTRRASIEEGQIKHSKLGWKRLTVIHPYLYFL